MLSSLSGASSKIIGRYQAAKIPVIKAHITEYRRHFGAPKKSITDLPDLVLHKIMARLPAVDFTNARLAARKLAEIGQNPKLPVWDILRNRSIAQASGFYQLVALIN